jgi:DNA-binding NarL/FixJ family response regulator
MWLAQHTRREAMSATARATGWAAIAFAIVYVGTFVSNMVLMILGPASGVRYKTPDQMIADRLSGDVGAVGFALMGATLIAVAIGLRRLIWSEESIVGAAASSVGVIAGAGLMLMGAAIGAARGFAANDLAATGADLAMQRAVVQGGSLLANAAFFLVSLALLIWLSSVAVASRVRAALSAGAAGYVVKDAGHAEIVAAVRAAELGAVVLGSGVATAGTSAVTFAEPVEDPFGLTRRERQVLDLVVRGLTNAPIAERLGLSGKTVSNMVSAILGKMGVHDRVEAAALARELLRP